MPFLLPAAATAVAAAAPAAAAAATTAAATAGITATLTSVATNILMNVAISAVMSALSPQVGAAGRTFEWTLDPDGPIPFAAGRIGVAGSAVYRETFGPDLMYYGIPSVISGAGPIDGFESFLADDESVTFDGTGKAISSQYAGELWYKTSLGAQPATAITSPSGLKSGATLPGWTSAHKLSGKASYMIVMGENSKGTAFPTGEIKPLVTVRGLKGWDPRLDSTYPGGSGSCRLNTPSTWVYLQNPILWALKWSLGLWEGPTGKGAPQVNYQVGGIGAKLSGIDVPAFVAAANVADANGWTVAAYPTTDDDKAQVLDAFLQAGGATYAQRAGKISCIQRAAPRTSIVTISGRDTAGPLEIDTAASRIDRINTIRPRYWSEAHRWQLTALPEVTASAYQTQDGGKRTRGIDYPYVTNPVQAAQLAALQIANTREGIAGVIPLKPHLQRIRPGDAFTITEEDFVLNGVKCLCLNTDYDPATGIVRVSFVSETDAKYPFALGQSPDVPVPPVLTPVDSRYVGPPVSGDWAVTVRDPSEAGSQVAVFDVVGSVKNATATGVIIELSPDGTDPWQLAWSGPPTATNIPVSGMQPGVSYFVAISYQRGQNVSGRLILGPFDTPEIVGLSPEDSEALDRLAIIESDNWLSKGEKPEVIRQWAAIDGEYTGLTSALTAADLTSTRTTYVNATTALANYLNSLTPAWNDVGTDTIIVGTELRAAFTAYYVAKQQANTALSAAAATDASTALSRLAIIDSDGVLSRNEKPEVIRQVTSLNDEYAGLAARGAAANQTAGVDAYSAAISGLNTYLNALTPAFSNTSVDTPITGTAFRAAFNTAYVAKQALLNAIVGVNTSASQAALAALDIIASDDWLSKGEKPELIRQYTVINSEYPALEAQANALGVTTQLTALANAITAMNTYLAGLSPAWNNLTVDTPMVGATLRSRVAACYTAKTTLQNALVGVVGVDAAAALSQLNIIASDNWLSRGEKPAVKLTVDGFNADYPALEAQATAMGATSALATLTSAIIALNDYLNALTPSWSNVAVDTPIVGATFNAKFAAVYSAREGLRNAMFGLVQADADAAAAGAAAALARLTAIESDGVLSKGEKPEVIRQVTSLNDEYAGLAARGAAVGATSTVSAYSAAITALLTYVGGLSPAYNDTSTDTPIVAGTFRSKFNDVYVTKQAVINAVLGANTSDVQTALGRLDIVASDNWLSAGEKPGVIQQYNVINGEYAGLAAQATALGVSTPLTTLATAIGALNSYLAGLSPAWDSLTTDTPIAGATFRSKFADCYTAKSALQGAMALAANATGQAALDQVARISSDSWLSAGEKPEIIRQYTILNGDYSGLAAQASALGVTTALTNHGNAIVALNNYLASLSPAWNNTSTDTPISASTFNSLFASAYSTKTALTNAFTAALDADAQAALDRVAAIDSDSILSRGEKPEIIRQWTAVSGEYSTIAGKLNTLGLSAALTSYNNATTALSNYLGSLNPAWDNTSVDTPISASGLTNAFANYSIAKQGANIAIAGASGGTPLRVTATPRTIGRSISGAGTYTTTTSVSLSVSGGSGSYAYDWFLTGASSDGGNAKYATITGSTGSTCAFTATVAAGETVIGSFACDVTDTVSGAKFTSLHSGRITETS